MKARIDRLTDRVARWIGWHLPRKVATHAMHAETSRRADALAIRSKHYQAYMKAKYRFDPFEEREPVSLSTYSDDQLHTFDSSVFGFTEDLP
jgi:hypothetical protein